MRYRHSPTFIILLKMSELNIQDLPSEILIKVFRFLDRINLKNATLTCKLWNYLIESACRWSLGLRYDEDDKLYCSYPSTDEEKLNYFLTTDRKFETIRIISGHLHSDSQTLIIFQRHGRNVVKLVLGSFRIENVIAFAELLRLTPNVKHVVIQYVDLDDLDGGSDLSVDEILPDLEKLKNLEMIYSDQRIIKWFGKAQLTTMRIRENAHLQHYGPMVDFLSSQKTLTSLTVQAAQSSSILGEMGKLTVPIPFRLTQLSIGIKSHYDDHILGFIQSQADNLTTLRMGCGVPNSVYECVFDSMTKLNTLTVDINGIPRDSDFYEGLKENCSVRVIKFQGSTFATSFSDWKCIGSFLKKLPNIRSLISMTTKVDILVMAQNLLELESLTIGRCCGSDDKALDSMNFSNLKQLHIEKLLNKINWNEFTKNHSELVELTISRMCNESFLTSDDIDRIITTNVDLQSIRLGDGFVADERFFEIIRAKGTNLKVLDLHKSCIPHGLIDNVEINVLRLRDEIECTNV